MIDIVSELTKAAKPENSEPMAKYMKNKFEFLGVKKPERELIVKPFLKEQKRDFKTLDWDFIFEMWAMKEREFQYVAIDYINAFKNFLQSEDIHNLRTLIVEKSWWDSVDGLAKPIGGLVNKNKGLEKTILYFSLDENIWLKRISIINQLGLKGSTNTELLKTCIINNFGSDEFFINKAIGWALREYAKTNESWVVDFVKTYEKDLSKLSYKEATKHLTI